VERPQTRSVRAAQGELGARRACSSRSSSTELKANANYIALQDELAGTKTGLLSSVAATETVQDYNIG
jgi:hypothetical protein